MKLGQIIAAIVAIIVFFLFGFSWRDIQRRELPSPEALISLVGLTSSGESVPPSMLFRQTYQKILNDYYEPVDPKKLKYAGISGMMASLGDPHTVFLEPKAAEEFAMGTRGGLVGVGARLGPHPKGAEVADVFKDGPADRAGMEGGDIILAVNGKSVKGLHIDDIVKQVRGKEGTKVRLKILKKDGKSVDITPTRAYVVTPNVSSNLIEGTQVGLISIDMFSEPTAEQFANAINELEGEGMKGLVIDLRDNPGGLLDTAVEMLSLFVEDKEVVKMKGKDGREEVARTVNGSKHRFPYPVVVLINGESASAAEIFAGVLRDYKLATLVGEHSYGKASVQNVRALRDQASAKITVARYYLPSGQDISRKVDEDGQYVSGGIPPDVKVELDVTKDILYGDPKRDNQLQKAIEILKSKM